MRFEMDAAYWSRQFPEEIMRELAERGREAFAPDGMPIEDYTPIAVAKLFQADGAGICLLAYIPPRFPDLVRVLTGSRQGVLGIRPEFHDVSIDDLKAIRGRLGLPLERDLYFVGGRPCAEYVDEAWTQITA